MSSKINFNFHFLQIDKSSLNMIRCNGTRSKLNSCAVFHAQIHKLLLRNSFQVASSLPDVIRNVAVTFCKFSENSSLSLSLSFFCPPSCLDPMVLLHCLKQTRAHNMITCQPACQIATWELKSRHPISLRSKLWRCS